MNMSCWRIWSVGQAGGVETISLYRVQLLILIPDRSPGFDQIPTGFDPLEVVELFKF